MQVLVDVRIQQFINTISETNLGKIVLVVEHAFALNTIWMAVGIGAMLVEGVGIGEGSIAVVAFES